ncbi:MAG: C69 family dipeptidase, partial [Candidatus Marinimicrobia bacterium]|nr:C69 family dipeptidase [Candidatus Neomarinimicrobiota bacterium]
MCDTFVILPEKTQNGSLIFGKNSDREPNEAQSVEFHPAKDFSQNDSVTCTYLTIPQARHTNTILISRPFWMWGAEMGINEHGVVIGNEAVFTRIPHESNDSLTGMDLLRLALERSQTSRQALDTITQLIDEFGQGGNCGYTSKLYYHNSFMIADHNDAWILETAGKYWAAKKVSGFDAISNRLSITKDFDLIHPEAISFALSRSWVKSRKSFSFAKCFSEPIYTRLTGSRTRLDASRCNLEASEGSFTVQTAMSHLRDHGCDPYDPKGQPLMDSICAHSANPVTRHSAQTCNSMIVELSKGNATVWTTMTSAPCTSVYKPIWLEAIPEKYFQALPDAKHSNDTLWWYHEKLHRSILLDYS